MISDTHNTKPARRRLLLNLRLLDLVPMPTHSSNTQKKGPDDELQRAVREHYGYG